MTARHDIVEAFGYLGGVDLWVLSLMIPAQIISYIATGEMIFSYLRAKGHIRHLTTIQITRLTLELNFVNHVFPSGGAAGAAYFSWLLGHHGVSAGRAVMAQIIRFALTFLSFVMLLLISLTILIIDHSVDRVTILLSLLLAVVATSVTLGGVYLISSRKRLEVFSGWISKLVNRIVRWVTRGRKRVVLREASITAFFDDIHDDYLSIRREKKLLVKPFLWATLANIFDVILIYIAFWSFGFQVNPALIFIAFGLASIAGTLVVTPGGAGAYEIVMVALLTSAGVPATTAIAGTLLARVLLILATIAFGYVFYQMTVMKYGKSPAQR